MRHALIVALALVLTACAQPKPKRTGPKPEEFVYTIDDMTKAQAEIAELKGRLKAAEDADHWSSSTIHQLQDHCDQGQRADGSARYAVSTANTPEAAMAAVNRVYARDGIETHSEEHIHVKTVNLSAGDNWPDIVCFTFGNQTNEPGAAKTCFDPMEITER